MNRRELGQLLNLSVELIAEGRPNRSGRKMSSLDAITVHNTSNASRGANAKAHSRFVREKGFYTLSSGKRVDVSWHYTVDDHEVIKHLPIDERAIHAGRGNAVSIGIEICMNQDIDQPAANLRAQRLIAALMHDLKLSETAIKTHKDWTGKNCPTLLVADFNQFRAGAAVILRNLDGSGPVESDTLGTTDEVVTSAEIKAREQFSDQEDPAVEEGSVSDVEHELVAEEVNAIIRKE